MEPGSIVYGMPVFWPTRLLHVDSMTSYESHFNHDPDPFTSYGQHANPSYFALSYTWGRWELPPGESPEIEALGVEGISWRIPRIRPSRFTDAQFRQVLRNIVSLHQMHKTRLLDDGSYEDYMWPESEFVWLDVACIDQTPGSPIKAQEIGRQAQIFRGAKRVFVWLHGLDPMTLRGAIEGLFSSSSRAFWIDGQGSQPRRLRDPVLRGDEAFLSDAIRFLEVLLSDPWFSSLWTLQESFLSPAALIVDREGTILSLKGGQVVPAGTENSSDIDMQVILMFVQGLSSICSRSIDIKKKNNIESLQPSKLEETLVALVDANGLSKLARTNPMALYTTANRRTTTHPCDRIYGIMQVFDFKLGSSAEGADSQKDYTLPELEVQFGSELLKTLPVLSQIVTHMEPVPFGQAWRVQASSKMPALAQYFTYYRTSSIWGRSEAKCDLSTFATENTTWACFSGYCIPFSQLLEVCLAVNKAGLYKVYYDRTQAQQSNRSCFQLTLDVSEITLRQSYLSSLDLSQLQPGQEEQHGIAEELQKVCQDARVEVHILLLGQYIDERRDRWVPGMTKDDDVSFGEKWNVGILLSKPTAAEGTSCSIKDEGSWRRLGIIVWDLANGALRGRTMGQRNVLDGEGELWKKQQGLFG